MAVKGLLRAFSGNVASPSEDDTASATMVADQAHRSEILDDFEQAGISWLWATDAEGRIIYLTEKAAENLGRPVSDLISEQFTTFFENDP
ncbi:MAG: PAS domain-containing protein, partial [Parasphingorhabdus sp.]